MKPNWKKVKESDFKKVIQSIETTSHTVMICDPAVTFYWDKTKDRGVGMEIYASAVGKVERNFQRGPDKFFLKVN